MSSDRDDALNLFFSYSHRDETLRDELARHLKRLEREGAIRPWHDRRIDAGGDWQGEISEHLETADVVLLLISSDFIASDYCYDVEMTRALARHDAGEARVIPVILRPSDWQTQRLARLQALPTDAKPVTEWRDRDSAFLDVTRGIRRVVEELRGRRPEPHYPSDAVRELSKSLELAYRRKAELEATGDDTAAVVDEILGLKRRLREGAQLQPGDLLADGRYQLLEPIGQGGFARVWKAWDRRGRSFVAIKVLHGQFAADRTRRDRFFRGARHMARLNHPNVVRVIEEEHEDGGFHFFVMEYISGGDFRQAVQARRLSPDDRLRIILETGDALAFAHSKGIVHRDVKPGNILLDAQGRAKLTDFDLVRAVDTTGGTRTTMLGTFLYAAPEAMVDARQAGAPADVYGLGMTAIFAFHGADLPVHILWELPEFIAELKISEDRRKALARAMARKVTARWATVAELCDALRSDALRVVIESIETGKERINEKDGSVLVYVPGGVYTLGTNKDIEAYAKDEYRSWPKPEHSVILSPFWIGKYPVTNEQYARFLKANLGEPKPAYWDEKQFNEPQQPVVGVSWLEATAYCRWAGLELPSEAQWEVTARGTDARPYPWGNEEPSERLANFGDHVGHPSPVGAYPEGAGPYGTLDQAGNVWEWGLDAWDEKAYKTRDGKRDPVVAADESDADALRVVRGGSWDLPAWILHVAFRDRFQARHRLKNLGFRVMCRFGPEHGS
jgi:formylglycine-generating enzyme required for sulfatase activity